MLFTGKLCRISAFGLLVVTLLLGCASTPNATQNDDENLLGQNIQMLYQQWGQPDYRSNTSGQEQQLHIWDINGCMSNVSTRANGTITGYAETGDCTVFQEP